MGSVSPRSCHYSWSLAAIWGSLCHSELCLTSGVQPAGAARSKSTMPSSQSLSFPSRQWDPGVSAVGQKHAAPCEISQATDRKKSSRSYCNIHGDYTARVWNSMQIISNCLEASLELEMVWKQEWVFFFNLFIFCWGVIAIDSLFHECWLKGIHLPHFVSVNFRERTSYQLINDPRNWLFERSPAQVARRHKICRSFAGGESHGGLWAEGGNRQCTKCRAGTVVCLTVKNKSRNTRE